MNSPAQLPRKTLLQRWQSISFSHRLTLGITALHFLLMSAMVLDLLHRQHEFLHHQGHQHASSLAKTLAVSSASWVMANDVVGLQEVTSSVANNPNVRYVMVLAPDLRVLSHSDHQYVGLYTTDPASQKLLKPGHDITTAVEVVRKHSLDDIAAPIVTGDKLIGWARVGLNQSHILDNLIQALIHAALYIIAGSLIAYVFARLVSKWLITGLARLADSFARFGAGERGLRIDIEREDELGQLAKGFNLMVNELEAKEASLQAMATTDFLTGLQNRRSFMQRLQAELARIQRSPEMHTALLLLDLDHFKRINDSYGHIAGDAVLKHVSDIMEQMMRTSDLAARFGGEEFIILLQDCDLECAQVIAERIRQKIGESPLNWEQQQILITTSIGVTMLRADDQFPDNTVNRADTAMYRAKAGGRNQVQIELQRPTD